MEYTFKIRVNLPNVLAVFEIILVPQFQQLYYRAIYAEILEVWTVERVPNYDVSYHEICYRISQYSGKIYPIWNTFAVTRNMNLNHEIF